MEILVGYGIGLRMERVIRLYWDHLLMVDQSGQYYGSPLQGLIGVTKGTPLPPLPTILNMEVDAVIWQWFKIVAGRRQVQKVSDGLFSGLRSF